MTTAHDIKDRLNQCKDLKELARVWAEVEPEVRKLKNPMRIHCVNLKDQLKLIMKAEKTGYLG